LKHDYPSLRQAVLELYLSVKIRSDEEIDEYNKDLFDKEKDELAGVDGYDLIDYIKSSIEVLMNMKMEETDQTNYEDEDRYKRGKYSDIDEPDIDVKLPSGALKGLKDASLDQADRMDTEMMNKHLEKSLKLVKKGETGEEGQLILDNKMRAKKDKQNAKKGKEPVIDKLNQPSITNVSQSSSILAL